MPLLAPHSFPSTAQPLLTQLGSFRERPTGSLTPPLKGRLITWLIQVSFIQNLRFLLEAVIKTIADQSTPRHLISGHSFSPWPSLCSCCFEVISTISSADRHPTTISPDRHPIITSPNHRPIIILPNCIPCHFLGRGVQCGCRSTGHHADLPVHTKTDPQFPPPGRCIFPWRQPELSHVSSLSRHSCRDKLLRLHTAAWSRAKHLTLQGQLNSSCDKRRVRP